jgi:hypothetical protein
MKKPVDRDGERLLIDFFYLPKPQPPPAKRKRPKWKGKPKLPPAKDA